MMRISRRAGRIGKGRFLDHTCGGCRPTGRTDYCTGQDFFSSTYYGVLPVTYVGNRQFSARVGQNRSSVFVCNVSQGVGRIEVAPPTYVCCIEGERRSTNERGAGFVVGLCRFLSRDAGCAAVCFRRLARHGPLFCLDEVTKAFCGGLVRGGWASWV